MSLAAFNPGPGQVAQVFTSEFKNAAFERKKRLMANKDGLWLSESFQNLDSAVEPHPEKLIVSSCRGF